MREPFRELRLICDADEHGLGFDLVYRSEYGPISEPQHVRRQGDRILLDASRFAGVGTWEGELRVDGDTIAVTPDRYTATRDRSWGIRPVGEAEPAGRPNEFTGMWWCWIPLRFDDFALHVILEEDRDGAAQHELRGAACGPRRPAARPNNSAGRCPRSATQSGTRHPTHASIDLTNRDGKTSTLEIEPIIGIPLNVGCGYGADPDWTHGVWKGDGLGRGLGRTTTTTPRSAAAPRSRCGTTSPRATFDGQEGYGIFEHGCIGPTPPAASPTSPGVLRPPATILRRGSPELVRAEAAVDEEDLAGHEARRVGDEVEHGADHLVGCAARRMKLAFAIDAAPPACWRAPCRCRRCPGASAFDANAVTRREVRGHRTA